MGNYLSNTSTKKISPTDSVRPPDTTPSGDAHGSSNTYTCKVCNTETPPEKHLPGCTDPDSCMCLMQC